jgi:uridylate kinase
LLKLSGEALGGKSKQGLDKAVLDDICGEIGGVIELDVQVAIVVGGGNFFRGARADNLTMARASADYVGMLATVMNAIVLQQALVGNGIQARVQTAIPMSPIAEPYVRERALNHLDNGHVVLFAAGTGSPFFTTDTAASLKAVEIGAGILLKATQVDGVYDRDPNKYEDARRYDKVSYDEVLRLRLNVMDATAVALCREHDVPLRIFNIRDAGCLRRIVTGDNSEGTLVHGGL